ncbi:hypothetical protein PHSY_005291 [Pseudozyma hubeiensis SY62]|uniref:Endoplasmic reticulum-based factor for assembly of V-ATPase n=1 Tax=Pseudozyma hubeiensis (strain SY62) TaxID=1305764 RepID=R9P8N2_PSEHS|nr:hypothetical protein PHSY_005291 [Pseudozyma hubeiensis SY62]GAC97704.1 hypothetical protein PHSY_005291 [Pseudozyma hubeiensis SY62]
MTKLVLSVINSEMLRQLARSIDSDHDAVQSLKAALLDQPEQPKMTTESPAVPTNATASTTSAEPVVLEHLVLIGIASWARTEVASQRSSVDLTQLKVASLVTGAHVYVPPKPVFKRSQQLEDSLAAIRKAQELAEYQRMSSTTTTSSSRAYNIPSAYVNIAGVDPTLSLSQRITSSHTTSPHLSSSNVSRQEEEQAWKDAQRQLSVILNIFLSALATATAAWWASGNASVGNKVLTSMLVGVVTAVAEIVLYSRYSVYVSESRKIKTSRMKGSDVKAGIEGFRPLQLDRVGNTPKASTRLKPSAKEEPS